MFSPLLRAVHGSRNADNEPPLDPDPGSDPDIQGSVRLVVDNDASPGPATSRAYARHRHATADFTEADDDDEESNEDDGLGHAFPGARRNESADEDGDHRAPHVLPLFSASHLDSLPVYNITHAIRIIVQARTETTLSWDQLRSPQVSQFLVKPMQVQIRTQHFSRATLYALMANCLQFAKEGQLFPGNAGTSSTRAKVCELLAIKLLKEYTTRELIDALSYDFNPLQGMSNSQYGSSAYIPGLRDSRIQRLVPAARTSTLEVAIRANAKHLLAHPLVVQQLEAIWNGAISFYSSADTLHRSINKAWATTHLHNTETTNNQAQQGSSREGARTGSGGVVDSSTPLLGVPGKYPAYHGQQQQHQPGKEDQGRFHLRNQPAAQVPPPAIRRTVSLYDPRNASLFKLSRLRVPRYRQFFSTCSLAVMIGLFLAVLSQHSNRITSLELVFWFWSAGFMLDELVGFNEQGFSLYIMSFWNIFDLGILLLLIFYYSLRICGVFLADAQRWNNSAYDILAANAILLLPRIFSVLDHYQYFSQLLIAFRLMAVDLAAVFVLIMISCSGFFVFFTLSKNESDPADVAYQIFQILMGFTPAAWDAWSNYNYFGKALLALFLIICHFVVVTILITVLTNSFMAIALNANEEHQFLFALNTISMVKNDALFSYIAPTNIFAWMLMPLRYCMPLPHFVALNRIVIKVTHFPILFGIFIYEKFFLAPFMYEPTDLVENTHRSRNRTISFADPASRSVFNPSVRMREESVVGFQKDRALDEVFRRTPDIATLRTQRRHERRKTQTAIRNWMDHNDGIMDSPHNYSTIDGRLDNDWQSRLSGHRERGSHRFRHMSEVRSTASDPADLLSLSAIPTLPREQHDTSGFGILRGPFESAFKDHTDAEGDDELVTNDEDEEGNTTTTDNRPTSLHDALGRSFRPIGDDEVSDDQEGDYYATPTVSRFVNVEARSPQSSKEDDLDKEAELVSGHGFEARPLGEVVTMSPSKKIPSRRALHTRALSSNTILYNPPNNDDSGDENIMPRQSHTSLISPPSPKPRTRPNSSRHGTPIPGTPTGGQRSPRRSMHQARPRQILPLRDPVQVPSSRAAAIFSNTTLLDTPLRRAQRRMSSFDAGTDTQSELTSAVSAVLPDDTAFAAMPASFTSQLALATAMKARASGESDRDRDRMSRLVLARMKTLEESFTDVVRELRTLQKQQQELGISGHASSVSASDDSMGPRPKSGGKRKSGTTTPAASSTVYEAASGIRPVGAQHGVRSAGVAGVSAGGGGGTIRQRTRLPTRPPTRGSGTEEAGQSKKAKGKEVERVPPNDSDKGEKLA